LHPTRKAQTSAKITLPNGRHPDMTMPPNASSGRPPHSIFDQGRQPDSLGTSLRATKKTQ
ncbi:hypothetical protein ACCT08_36700, partial [Rhizobium johnstonii]|uniref:hypothetical protein n=1 Tax=Rhizobium johnstonii TaxID=3019933 RepID=UPI003F95CD13